MEQPSFIAREPRLPLFVPVQTRPRLRGCWSVNISRLGLGLQATIDPQASLTEGDGLELVMELPGCGLLRARGTVMWLYEHTEADPAGNQHAIGVRLTHVEPDSRANLDRYLFQHRFQVAVAFAGEAQRRVVESTLADLAHLHWVESESALRPLILRGDISAVLFFGDDARESLARLHRLLEQLDATLGGAALPQDAWPAILYCAPASAQELLPLLNAQRLFRVLDPTALAATLESHVLDACREHGRRTEQRRSTLALERALLRQASMTDPPGRATEAATALVARSPSMRHALTLLRKVAPHTTSVLLQGETGTGKEVLARRLHDISKRCHAAFVVQDCGVLTESLLESELFGHIQGAFTGAVTDNPGLFVFADGGTVFLDEVENTSADLQAKLLRVIEAGTVRAVGSARTRTVDVRVVAASNRDLAQEVRAGRFRADLYYRLNAFPIRIPPLRERIDDILPLAEYLLADAGARLGLSGLRFTATAKRVLQNYAWPGNIRELRNTVERAAILAGDGAVIDITHLADLQVAPLAEADRAGASLRQRVRNYERRLIAVALDEHGYVLRRAARALGISHVTLRRKAMAYGLLGEANASSLSRPKQ